MLYIKLKGPCVATFPNTEETVEDSTWSGVFLTDVVVFRNVVYTV